MLSLLNIKPDHDDYGDRLQITEAPIMQMKDEELKRMTQDCDAVVSCLGHQGTSSGIWGKEDRGLVTSTVRRLTSVMPSSAKFIVMGSELVSAPGDDQRGFLERLLLSLLRLLIPPHVDNEQASDYMFSLPRDGTSLEWCIVRPTSLREGPPRKYAVYSKPPGSLFGGYSVSRATVATFMVDLLTDAAKWDSHKYQAPVVHEDPPVSVAGADTAKSV